MAITAEPKKLAIKVEGVMAFRPSWGLMRGIHGTDGQEGLRVFTKKTMG